MSGISYQLNFFKILCQFQGRTYILVKLNERNPSSTHIQRHMYIYSMLLNIVRVYVERLSRAPSLRNQLYQILVATQFIAGFFFMERESSTIHTYVYGSLLITRLFRWYSEQKRIKFVSVELPLQFQKTILQIASVSSHLLQQRPRQTAVNRSSNMQIAIKKL